MKDDDGYSGVLERVPEDISRRDICRRQTADIDLTVTNDPVARVEEDRTEMLLPLIRLSQD